MADQYEIHLNCHLDREWEEWFEGFSFSYQPDGITVLTGTIEDQPALHGLLARISQLGLTLVKVERMKQEAENE